MSDFIIFHEPSGVEENRSSSDNAIFNKMKKLNLQASKKLNKSFSRSFEKESKTPDKSPSPMENNVFAITKKTDEPTEKEESPETIPIPSTDMAIDGDTKKDDKATDGDENTKVDFMRNLNKRLQIKPHPVLKQPKQYKSDIQEQNETCPIDQESDIPASPVKIKDDSGIDKNNKL